MLSKVYVLVYGDDWQAGYKVLGVYASQELANKAREGAIKAFPYFSAECHTAGNEECECYACEFYYIFEEGVQNNG